MTDVGRTPERQAMRRPATGADVARLAGVSKSAVSRTFSKGIVAPETRDKILAAASQLKYRPSFSAAALTTKRSGIVGVAVTHLDNQFYPEIIEGLATAFAAQGYRVLLFIARDHSDHDPVLDELLRHRVDAVVLASSSLSAALAAECEDAGIPAIMLNSADPAERAQSVTGADVKGAAQIADFLVAGGHRRFAYISGLAESSTSWRRGQGFATSLRRHGLPPPRQVSGDFTFEGSADATRMLLGSGDPPDAIFCGNDHMALAALQVARSEFGLDVGRDVSVVGFDDVKIAGWPAFALTTYSQPADAMVAATIACVLGALAGETSETRHIVVEGELIVRGSARVPAEGVVVGANGRRTWGSVPR